MAQTSLLLFDHMARGHAVIWDKIRRHSDTYAEDGFAGNALFANKVRTIPNPMLNIVQHATPYYKNKICSRPAILLLHVSVVLWLTAFCDLRLIGLRACYISRLGFLLGDEIIQPLMKDFFVICYALRSTKRASRMLRRRFFSFP